MYYPDSLGKKDKVFAIANFKDGLAHGKVAFFSEKGDTTGSAIYHNGMIGYNKYIEDYMRAKFPFKYSVDSVKKAQAGIDKTEAFFHSLNIQTKLSEYTPDFEGTASKIAERFTQRGWMGLGEHKNIKPADVEKIVEMSY